MRTFHNAFGEYPTAPVPRWLARRTELDASAKLLYAFFLEEAEGESYVPLQWPRIMRELGMCEAEARRAHAALLVLGMVTTVIDDDRPNARIGLREPVWASERQPDDTGYVSVGGFAR